MLIIKGVPGSPYTRKMLSLLRFRHIPYRYVQQGNSPLPGLPEPKVSLLPVVYLTDQEGECEALVDSTPIIRRLEANYPGRASHHRVALVYPRMYRLGYLFLILKKKNRMVRNKLI